jgi:hypothetical protein
MFTVNKDTDYNAMAQYIDVLSVALSGIPEYVVEELTSSSSQPRKNGPGDKPLTMLEQIQKALELLHGKIVDTRAAHLDRSRAKAALKQLSKKVEYQRKAALNARPSRRQPKDIRGFFAGNDRCASASTLASISTSSTPSGSSSP